jgi:hypothetical protein
VGWIVFFVLVLGGGIAIAVSQKRELDRARDA